MTKEELEQIAQSVKDKIASEAQHGKADAWMDKGASWLSRRVGPLSWLGSLFDRLTLWQQVLLILAIICGLWLAVWLGWNSFTDWAADKKYQQATAALQEQLEDYRTRANTAEEKAIALQSEVDALKVESARLAAEAAAQSERVQSAQKRTATATIAYNDAKSKPVAAVEIDASTDKALETSLQRLTEAVKAEMKRGGQ